MIKMWGVSNLLIDFCVCLALIIGAANGEYLIGVGSYDMTGPAAEVNMMGYANPAQNTAGIHFRLRARAFIVAESSKGSRFAFVNLDAGMPSQLVNIRVIERLKSRYGNLYTEENVAISGIHTHAGPGGYLQYLVYTITATGFVDQSFNAIVNAIEQSIVEAHQNLKPGSIFINTGEVENAGINRSPSAYLLNPKEERARYGGDVDKEMTLLKFVESGSGKSIGAFSWYATHGTSMSRDNMLISGDNKGAAARFFEDWFTSSNTSSLFPNFFTSSSGVGSEDGVNKLVEKAKTMKATGGQSCSKTASEGFKVRKKKGLRFVGAFCQSNVGDVSPNVMGAFCTDSGKPCDFNHSSCHGDVRLCVGRGPGYPDEVLSTKIIGERQFRKAVDLLMSATKELSGKVDYRHVYLNFTDLDVDIGGNKKIKTCPAGLGAGFAAGTTDGPGVFGFQQGDLEIDPSYIKVRDGLKKPSQYQEDCQKPKAVLLSTGEMFEPYAWAPAILPIQILRIGKLIILSVPGEFTTMAGRRLREAVKKTLISNGRGEFDDETHIVIAGLTNTYSQYVATIEEYSQQRYEGASTLYGPHTLSAYIQEFNKLGKALAKGEKINERGISPPNLFSKQLRILTDPLRESPPKGIKFGDIKEDVIQPKKGSFKKGDRPSATFWSANPRFDLLTEGTFALVEMLQRKRWISVYDDDDFCLYFKWRLDNSTSSSLATIEWEVPNDARTGIYRLRHFGSSKKTKNSPNEYFTGASSAFTVS